MPRDDQRSWRQSLGADVLAPQRRHQGRFRASFGFFCTAPLLPGPRRCCATSARLRKACAPATLQHARPDGPHSAAGAPDRRGFFLLCRYMPPEKLRLRLTHHERHQAVSRGLSLYTKIPNCQNIAATDSQSSSAQETTLSCEEFQVQNCSCSHGAAT